MKRKILIPIVFAAVVYLALPLLFAAPITHYVKGIETNANLSGAVVSIVNCTDSSELTNFTLGANASFTIDASGSGWDNYSINITKSNYVGTNFKNSSDCYNGDIAAGRTFYLYRLGHASINVTLKDKQSGRPIPDAVVNVIISSSGEVLNQTDTYNNYRCTSNVCKTDNDGNSLLFVSAGSDGVFYNVSITHNDYESFNEMLPYKFGLSWKEGVNISEGEDADYSIEVFGNVKVDGDITDYYNNKTINAFVELLEYSDATHDITGKLGYANKYFYNTTAVNGRYTIKVPSSLINDPNRYVLNASDSSYQEIVWYTGGSAGSGFSGEQEIDLSMKGILAVSGSITDCYNNETLSSGHVNITEKDNPAFQYWIASDSSGNFNFNIRNSTGYYLNVYKNGYMQTANLTAITGNFSGSSGVCANGSVSVTGNVIDAYNSSISLDNVLIEVYDKSASQKKYDTYSDSNGDFLVKVPSTLSYEVKFSKAGYTGKTLNESASTSGSFGNVSITGAHRIYGTVKDSERSARLNGTELQNVNVKIVTNTSNVYQAITDSSGAYGIYVPSTDEYNVTFSKSGYNSSSSDSNSASSSATELNATLYGSIHIEGKAYDSERGDADQGVSSAVITVTDGGITYQKLADSKGNYSINIGLVNSNFNMTAGRAGYESETSTGLNEGLVSGGVNFYLDGSATVDITVKDAFSGDAVEGVKVNIYDPSNDNNISYSQTLNSTGRYVFKADSTLSYKVGAFHPNGNYLPQITELQSGSMTKTFSLEAKFEAEIFDGQNSQPIKNAVVKAYHYSDTDDLNATLNKTILNITSLCSGTAVAGMNVTLNKTSCASYQAGLCYFSKDTDANGNVSFEQVPTGSYNLSINGSAQGCEYKTESYTVTDSMAGIENSVEKPVLENSLAVFVQNNSGAIGSVNVTLWDGDVGSNITQNYTSDNQTALTNSSGYVIFHRIFAGSYNISVNLTPYDLITEEITVNYGSNSKSYTLDDSKMPQYSTDGDNVTTSDNTVNDTGSVKVYAYWTDNLDLAAAWVYTNESGSYALSTLTAQPVFTFTSNPQWSNFTLDNLIDQGGKSIGWILYANDSYGNTNSTSGSFKVNATWEIRIVEPENKSYSSTQNYLNYTLNQTMAWCGYSLNEAGNVTVSNTDPSSKYGITGIVGSNNLTLYCNDSSSNWYEDTVYWTVDTVYPGYSSVGQNRSSVDEGEKVLLYALWQDNVELDSAWLSTNESGIFENKTAVQLSGTSSWSNFTWSNSSVPAGSSVAWRIYANDTAGNVNETSLNSFDVTAKLGVYVNDTEGNYVGTDKDGYGVNVTLKQGSSVIATANTSSGFVNFTGLSPGTYDIITNGTWQGYGDNTTSSLSISGIYNLSVILNITKLIVNVTDSSFNPVNANVTVYVNYPTEILKNATGSDLVANITDGSGVWVFNRTLPCTNCNVTVQSSDKSPQWNWNLTNITVGNESNYVWVDPDYGYTTLDDGTTSNVTVSVRNSTNALENATVVWHNKLSSSNYSKLTDSDGNVTFELPSGLYDLEVNGGGTGYGIQWVYDISIGKLVFNNGTTDSYGMVSFLVDGARSYYIYIEAAGYAVNDSLADSVALNGTYYDNTEYDQSLFPSLVIDNTYKVNLYGLTTIQGYVTDKYANGAVENLTNVLVKIKEQGESTYRYVFNTSGSNFYSLMISPFKIRSTTGAPSSTKYDVEFILNGYNTLTKTFDMQSYINTTISYNAELTGSGKISGNIYSATNGDPISGFGLKIQVYNSTSGGLLYETEIAAQGYFGIDFNPLWTPYYLRILPGDTGYYSLTSGNYTQAESTLKFYLYLNGQAKVHFNVKDNKGEDVPSAVLQVYENGDFDKNLTVTDGYVVFVPNSSYWLYNFIIDEERRGYKNWTVSDVSFDAEMNETGGNITYSITLETTDVNVTVLNQNSEPVDGLSVTLNSVPQTSTTDANGSALFYRVPLGTHTITFDTPEWLEISSDTINVAAAGIANNKTISANETQYYLNITNGSAGIGSITVNISGSSGVTNSTGEVIARKVLPGNDTEIELNKTEIYLLGYFPPNKTEYANVTKGKDYSTGNSKTITLNSTKEYGIFAVDASTGTTVSLWDSGKSVMIDSGVASSTVYLSTFIATYNESLYIQAVKSGYNTAWSGPFNITDQNVTFVSVSLTPVIVQETPGGGGGGVITVLSSPEKKGVSFVTNMQLELPEIYLKAGECINENLLVRNTGTKTIHELKAEDKTFSRNVDLTAENVVDELLPGRTSYITVRACASKNAEKKSYSFGMEVSSREITKRAYSSLYVTHTYAEVLLARADAVLVKLKSVDRESLDSDKRKTFDDIFLMIENAKEYVAKGSYDAAEVALDAADKKIAGLLPGKKPISKLLFIIPAAFILLAVIMKIRSRKQVYSFRPKREYSPRISLPTITEIKKAVGGLEKEVVQGAEREVARDIAPIMKVRVDE